MLCVTATECREMINYQKDNQDSLRLWLHRKYAANTPAPAPIRTELENVLLTAAPVLPGGGTALLLDAVFPVAVGIADVAFAEPPVVAAALAIPLELPLGVGEASTLAASFSAPAVMVTGRCVTPVHPPSPLYVSVLLPGKFASLPLALSLHRAVVEPKLQSAVIVKSSSPGSDMSIT